MMLFILLLLSALIAIVTYLQRTYNYWPSKGVKQLKVHYLWGHAQKLVSVSHSEILQETYDTFKASEPLAGLYIFTKPVAVILDLDLAKSILIKDFNLFVNRHTFHDSNILTQHLFRVGANKWKGLRRKLTPTFTTGKMKFMFPTMMEVAERFAAAFEEQRLASPDHCLEMHEMNSRFTTEVISSCVLGLDGNSLKDPNDQFRVIGRNFFKPRNHPLRWTIFKMNYSWIKYVGARPIPKLYEEFFVNLTKTTVLERERLQIKRRDFIDLLIDLKNSSNKSDALDIDLMAAQLFVFFIAGFETSSSNMSYCLYELANHPQKQDKLRQEILDVMAQHDNKITYEAVMSMSYMEQVIKETLRLYPALAFLQRVAMADYKLPNTNVTLPKGTMVYIPAKAIHYDVNIYDEPHGFRPERFDPIEVKQRHPLSFLGFGDGPRNCIGARFGFMQIHIGLITLLSKYRFLPLSNDVSTKRVEVSKRHLIMIPAKGVTLRAEKL